MYKAEVTKGEQHKQCCSMKHKSFGYKKHFTVASLLALATLSGCAAGPDYKKPEYTIPAGYDNTTENPTIINENASLEWWELFDDPSIDALVHIALENNNDVQIALARIDEAAAQFGFTNADKYPHFFITGGAQRGDFAQGGNLTGPMSSYYLAPTAAWEIDFWGKLRRASESAKASMIATEYGTRAVYLKLISDVITTYFDLLASHDQLRISQNTLKSRQASLDIIQERFKEGIVPELDVNQAEIQKEIAITAIETATRAVENAEGKLNILLGQMPKNLEIITSALYKTKTKKIPVGLPSTLLLKRPDILEAEQRLKAQNAQIGVAIAQRFPSISLTGAFGLASNDLSNFMGNTTGWSIGASLMGPIFQFGKNKERVAIQRAKTKQAVEAYEKTVITAFRDVELALVGAKTYLKESESSKRKLAYAKRANELSELRYNTGISSFLEVLESQRTLFNVEIEYAKARRNYLSSFVKLYAALGGGWVSEDAKMMEQQNIPSQKEDTTEQKNFSTRHRRP